MYIDICFATVLHGRVSLSTVPVETKILTKVAGKVTSFVVVLQMEKVLCWVFDVAILKELRPAHDLPPSPLLCRLCTKGYEIESHFISRIYR